jgi:hypothetical protein
LQKQIRVAQRPQHAHDFIGLSVNSSPSIKFNLATP